MGCGYIWPPLFIFILHIFQYKSRLQVSSLRLIDCETLDAILIYNLPEGLPAFGTLRVCPSVGEYTPFELGVIAEIANAQITRLLHPRCQSSLLARALSRLLDPMLRLMHRLLLTLIQFLFVHLDGRVLLGARYIVKELTLINQRSRLHRDANLLQRLFFRQRSVSLVDSRVEQPLPRKLIRHTLSDRRNVNFHGNHRTYILFSDIETSRSRLNDVINVGHLLEFVVNSRQTFVLRHLLQVGPQITHFVLALVFQCLQRMPMVKLGLG